MKKTIRTDLSNLHADTVLDLGTVSGAMDISFRNIGATTVTITTLEGGKLVIAPGDPMETWGGYEGYYRTDVLNFSFSAGVSSLLVYINIHANIDC